MTKWFRNEQWNDEIERSFFEKLNRARVRNRQQYLRIQACHLIKNHPCVTLKLLEHYFRLGLAIDTALAHVHVAEAWLGLGNVDRALKAYEDCFQREEEFPNSLTNSFVEMPFIIALHKIKERYEQALEILDNKRSRLAFPVLFFKWHAAKALIFSDLREHKKAMEHAQEALFYANVEQSEFQFHRKLGLVDSKYEDIRNQLKRMLD